jgi:hypothetical protein
MPTAIAAAVVGLYCVEPYGAGLTFPLETSERGMCSGKPLLVLGGATSVGQYGISTHYIYAWTGYLTYFISHSVR